MMLLKSLLVLLPFIAPAGLNQSGDSWSVTLNGKKAFQTSTEDETKNVLAIKTASLKNKNNFIITYKEQPPVKDWDRFIAIETADTSLKEVKAKELRLTNAALLNLFKKSKTLEVYSWSLPKDLEMRKRVRIRRVHLMTLELK